MPLLFCLIISYINIITFFKHRVNIFLYVVVLSLVERIHLRKLTTSVLQRRAALVEELREEGIDEFAKLVDSPGCRSYTDMDIRIRRRDHISHFVLRSAVAFNALKKRWFFKQEARLFKWRFSSLDNEGIRQFMYINNFNFTPVSCCLLQHFRFNAPEINGLEIFSIVSRLARTRRKISGNIFKHLLHMIVILTIHNITGYLSLI